jgi:hypothetical protein
MFASRTMTPTAALLLALAIPTAPAPKADKGLPKELIDLIPEDTAGVLILDVPVAAKSEIGKAFLKVMTAEQKPDEPIQVADFVRDAELVIVAQFLIDEAFGDFCILVRHKEKSDIPKALIDRADKAGKDTAPERIGKRNVYSLGDAGASFTRVDDRTLMFVLATGSPEQVKQTRSAAYGEREKPGPAPALRKMLAEDRDDRAVRLYGCHPKKLALSTWLLLAPFGVKDKTFNKFEGKVASYHGGIKAGEAAEIELRITANDADTAKQLLQAYEAAEANDSFIRELRATAKAVRDGEDLIITAKVTAAMVDRLGTRPNK